MGDLVARRRSVPDSVVCGLCHRAHDRVLHVPPDVSHVPRACAHESRGRTPHPRVAEVHDHAAGGAGALRDRRGMVRMAAQSRRLRPFHEIPRTGVRRGSADADCRRQGRPVGCGRKRRRAQHRHRMAIDGPVAGRSGRRMVHGCARLRQCRQGLHRTDRRRCRRRSTTCC